MSKETIGIDLDDVLADHASAFAVFSNRHYGTDISRETYTERWDELWEIDDWDEILRRANEFHTPESAENYLIVEGAQNALQHL